MFNSKVVVTCVEFGGSTTPDKNGEKSVMLICQAGKMPNRNTIAGTVAERAGFSVGHTYLAQCLERGTSEQFGPRYQFIKISEVTPIEVIQLERELGSPVIFEVPKTEYVLNEYQRKTDKVISQTQREIEAGTFTPATIQKQVQMVTEKPANTGNQSEADEELSSKNG